MSRALRSLLAAVLALCLSLPLAAPARAAQVSTDCVTLNDCFLALSDLRSALDAAERDPELDAPEELAPLFEEIARTASTATALIGQSGWDFTEREIDRCLDISNGLRMDCCDNFGFRDDRDLQTLHRISEPAIQALDDLTDAMDSRCYSGSKGRTRLKVMHIRVPDVIASLIMVALFFFVLLVVYNWWGWEWVTVFNADKTWISAFGV